MKRKIIVEASGTRVEIDLPMSVSSKEVERQICQKLKIPFTDFGFLLLSKKGKFLHFIQIQTEIFPFWLNSQESFQTSLPSWHHGPTSKTKSFSFAPMMAPPLKSTRALCRQKHGANINGDREPTLSTSLRNKRRKFGMLMTYSASLKSPQSLHRP